MRAYTDGICTSNNGTITNVYCTNPTSVGVYLDSEKTKEKSSFSGFNFTLFWDINPTKNDGYPFLRYRTVGVGNIFPNDTDKDKYINTILKTFHANADSEKLAKKKFTVAGIREKIYNLIFVANYRPNMSVGLKDTALSQSVLGSTSQRKEQLERNKDWPYKNSGSYGTSLSATRSGLEKTVRWGMGSKGCYSYACFGNAYVYDNPSNPLKFSRSLKGVVTASQIKQHFNKYADSGEHIRYYYNDNGSSVHSLIYLGEDELGAGFYCLGYNGGRTSSKNDIEVRYWAYEAFAKKVKYNSKAGFTVAIWGDFNMAIIWGAVVLQA